MMSRSRSQGTEVTTVTGAFCGPVSLSLSLSLSLALSLSLSFSLSLFYIYIYVCFFVYRTICILYTYLSSLEIIWKLTGQFAVFYGQVLKSSFGTICVMRCLIGG